jgi:hypothetical protein
MGKGRRAQEETLASGASEMNKRAMLQKLEDFNQFCGTFDIRAVIDAAEPTGVAWHPAMKRNSMP